MNYRVLVQRLAAQDLREAHSWAASNAPRTAARWLDRFEATLLSLSADPLRWPLAREARKLDVEIRERLFGKRAGIYRILFVVDGEVVRVLRILRARRRPLTAEQVRDALESDD